MHSQENYNLEVASHLAFPNRNMSNIWGYVDSLGNEYALMGTSRGLSIIDVSDPFNPELKFDLNYVVNDWREPKTYLNYVYVTTEGNNGGLTIIDLGHLPDTVYSHIYRGDGAINNQLRTSHDLYVTDGYAYIFGSNIGNGGVLFLNLDDPWNPVYEGTYDNFYVHDGFVANDTLWAAHSRWFFNVLDHE
ncbi:MAG: choice-of-anchor B family protein [Bacteroidia bacterium]